MFSYHQDGSAVVIAETQEQAASLLKAKQGDDPSYDYAGPSLTTAPTEILEANPSKHHAWFH